MALPVAGCDTRATTAECSQMLDKYVDMVLMAEGSMAEAARAASAEEARSMRAARLATHKEEAGYQRAYARCQTEISRREYRCAMKANTPEAWQACID